MSEYKKQPWFVKLQQVEVETLKTPMQVLVFMAIKSYTANGKREIGLSLRNIADRSKCSHETVRTTVPELTTLKIIEITGNEKIRGGQQPIYKVSTSLTVNNEKVSSHKTLKTIKSQATRHLKEESVNLSGESVKSTASKNRQLKNISNTTKEKNKKSTRGGSQLSKNLRTVIQHYNKTYNRKLSATKALENNFNYWVEKGYSLEDMKTALTNATYDTKFWADKMTPELLLRRKNQKGDSVDRIGEFLNKKIEGVDGLTESEFTNHPDFKKKKGETPK